jgi:hypothetical protein
MTKHDWGIPDWLAPGAYGDTGRWSWDRWHWEFTRRRDDVRRDFLAHKGEVPHFQRLQPDQPGFSTPVLDCHEKYGMSSLPNPAIGDQPFYVLFAVFLKRYPRPVVVGLPEFGTDDLKETDALMKFDLTAPLGDQLEAAQRYLEMKQKRVVGQIVNPSKKHPGKWLAYLRVLDARESGASYAEIAGSGALKGLRDHADAQAARDVWQQARALCFKWPA